ncbi:DUF368 domain-containing protein [Myxococcota bacterium]|nr:DUF368 domain-containing protein [Myxococcota bacterium]
MSDPTHSAARPERVSTLLVVRSAIGGALMGLANLVPGISGGTMLLASGVYPAFIAAIAEVTTLRFRLRSLVTLGAVAISAGLAILLLAGTIKTLVIENRWVMYSLFIGLTLGGIPLVWRMARPASASLVAGGAVTFVLMVVMAFGGDGARGGEASLFLMFLAGLAASSAMILPGVSGGYLLLLLGQYEAILGTVDQVKLGLLSSGGPDLGVLLGTANVVIPLGLGIVVGVVGVSNLLQWLLRRYPKATLGALLGLLFGAVVGLWPFQQSHPPEPGSVIEGRRVTETNLSEFDPEVWPVARFQPSSGQVVTSIALVGVGLGATTLIGRLGRETS